MSVLHLRLRFLTRDLPAPHLKVLVAMAERLVVGVERFGPEVQPRQWAKEAREEALDAAIYLTWLIEGEPESE